MKVPQYEERVETAAPTVSAPRQPNIASPGVVPGAFGADVGAAYEKLGQVGDRISAHLQQMAIDEQDKEVLKRETTYRQDLQTRLMDTSDETIQVNGQDVTRKKGLLLRQLGQAKGATEDLDSTYQTQLRKQYLGGLTKYQADKLASAMDNYYLSVRNNVITHESNQLDEDFKNTTESNLKQKIMDASLIRDDKQLAYAIDDAVRTIEPYNRKYDEATRKVQNEKTAEDIAKTAIISAIEQTGDYTQAKIMLEGIKDKISPATYTAISDEVGKRAVDMAIAADMSIHQEDSAVMAELQKGKKGLFGYLSTTEINKNIKESQQKIYYNSQIAKRGIEEQQNLRNDEVLNKISTDSLTLSDIEREMNLPEEQGGLPKKVLVNYKRAVQRGIEKDLNAMLKEKTTDGDPTRKAQAVKQYLDLIDSFVDDSTDKWYAREKLSAAYADGLLNKGETIFLNKLKNNLKDIEFNRSTGPINSAIKGLKSFLKQNNASDEEIAIRIKQLLGSQNINADTVKAIAQEHTKSKVPEASVISEKGQLMMDGDGNMAMVYPDGTIEPYIKQPKTKPAEAKSPEQE